MSVRKVPDVVPTSPVEWRIRFGVAVAVALYLAAVLVASVVGSLGLTGLVFGGLLIAAGLALGYSLGLRRGRLAARSE